VNLNLNTTVDIDVGLASFAAFCVKICERTSACERLREIAVVVDRPSVPASMSTVVFTFRFRSTTTST